MSVIESKILPLWLGIFIVLGIAACGGNGSDANTPLESARFTLDCDLNGLNGVMTMDVEVIQSSGIVWGSGPNPQITAVIGLGSATYYTSGGLVSPTAEYVFTGENSFADFTEILPSPGTRFRVQWTLQGTELIMTINPFGPVPTQHTCVTTSAVLL